MDVGHGCLLLDCAGRGADCDVVGPGSIASLALGSVAAWGNRNAVRDARLASPDSYRGDRRAAGSSPLPTATPSTRPLSAESAAAIGRSAEMERAAGSDAADAGRAAHPIR